MSGHPAYCSHPSRYAYSMHMDVEWDLAKAAANLKKHGISFEEASTALLDPQALAQEDSSTRTSLVGCLLGGAQGRACLRLFTRYAEGIAFG